VTGETSSTNYPITTGAFDTTFGGSTGSAGENCIFQRGCDAFVTKLNASGSALAYSTFLGGTDRDQGWGVAVRDGSAYVTGETRSANYPTTRGTFDRMFNADDAFVTKFNASGSDLAYSTFLGGTASDFGHDIAVGGSGRAYLTGSASPNYPTTPGAYDPSNEFHDAFVTKLPTG
jgi:hypothetical protein